MAATWSAADIPDAALDAVYDVIDPDEALYTRDDIERAELREMLAAAAPYIVAVISEESR